MNPTTTTPFDTSFERLAEVVPAALSGSVARITGLAIEAQGLSVPMGARCRVGSRLEAEVVGFREDRTILMGFGDLAGTAPGDPVRLRGRTQRIPVGEAMLGRVVDAQGHPVDGKGPLYLSDRVPLYRSSPPAMRRERIRRSLGTGVRVIDALLTCGRGQRLGLFSGSGVGKSVLMGMIARGTEADVSVIALVGERGREVREFIERDLGPEGLRRSVVVVATGDEPALLRCKAAFAATAIAEYFRDLGQDVLLLMDSITRLAFAQREIGLSAGEPPATKGYPPSVFAMMPRLLERAGPAEKGSITGIYTVLVEGDDLTEPVSDTARSILDGHVALSRGLANRGHFPAVDTLASVSRLMTEVVDRRHRAAAAWVLRLLAVHRDAEDMINIGAYVRGSNPEIDLAIQAMPAIMAFLKQDLTETVAFERTLEQLYKLVPVEAQA